MGLPTVVSWVPSACSLLASQHYQQLIDRGLVPLKDAEPLSNGHLDSTRSPSYLARAFIHVWIDTS
uniref:Uncharacterized protein n=1 Tax=Oryza glaberrima TaxID=4538 RepID=I1P0I9_ORYGL